MVLPRSATAGPTAKAQKASRAPVVVVVVAVGAVTSRGGKGDLGSSASATRRAVTRRDGERQIVGAVGQAAGRCGGPGTQRQIYRRSSVHSMLTVTSGLPGCRVGPASGEARDQWRVRLHDSPLSSIISLLPECGTVAGAAGSNLTCGSSTASRFTPIRAGSAAAAARPWPIPDHRLGQGQTDQHVVLLARQQQVHQIFA